MSEVVTGSTSDGYHTFDDLYAHRIALWKAVCRLVSRDPHYQYREVWRTCLHSDGTSYPGWFVLGMTMEDGRQLTYHLPITEWDNCSFAMILDEAPRFDGHTAADVIKRLEVV